MDPLRILLVEDDAFLREIYTDTLTKAGHAVSTATDGNEAMQKIKEGVWDVLLMDIILPHMDGIEIIKNVKKDPDYKNQADKPIIFLTNLDNDNEMKQAMELGNGYIIKSQINPGDLVVKIQEVLEK